MHFETGVATSPAVDKSIGAAAAFTTGGRVDDEGKEEGSKGGENFRNTRGGEGECVMEEVGGSRNVTRSRGI